MAVAGCMHTIPLTRHSVRQQNLRPLRPACAVEDSRQSHNHQQPAHAVPEQQPSSSSFSRRGLLAGVLLAQAAVQASSIPQLGTQSAAAVTALQPHEAASWCGASIHMLQNAPMATLAPSVAGAEQPSRPMPLADIADLGDGVTRLVPSGQASRMLTLPEKQVLEQNKRRQAQNSAPLDFPSFARQGFDIKILADGYSSSNGLIYKDFRVGEGDLPVDGQQVLFHYNAYNENGVKIDSSYTKGRPAQTRLGTKGLIPGFEQGIKDMKIGGRRRLVVPPELGPPVGPATFFSAKQCEVFDVELLEIKNCRRRQVAMFSDVVCE